MKRMEHQFIAEQWTPFKEPGSPPAEKENQVEPPAKRRKLEEDSGSP